MADPKLKLIVQLSAIFKDVTETKFQQNATQQAKLLEAVTDEEKQALQEQVNDIMAESMKYAFGGEPDDDFLKKNIAFMETLTKVYMHAIPKEELAANLPDQLRNQEAADAFKAMNAPTLAALCEYKPS